LKRDPTAAAVLLTAIFAAASSAQLRTFTVDEMKISPDGKRVAYVEFDIYPRGGHVLYEPALQRESMRRNLDWFTRWLRPESAPSQ